VAVVIAASLACGESLSVDDGVAATIRIDRGEVWLTEHGSFVDHILVAGQSYTFDRPGRAIVTAQADTRVAVLAPDEGPPPARIATARRTLYVRPLWWMLPALLWPAAWRRPAPVPG
jgi:hypothetical protein